MSDVEIRPLSSLDDFRACVELQEEVWGEGFSERVPTAILKVAQRLGGVVAGAWDGSGELAGFVFGMTGLEEGRPVHWSDMLAVRPGLRNRGLGARLKAHQRSVLLERGIDVVYWTFDPLESKNAHLNFSKLGIVVREYQENMYGETDSPLHRGIGTDRFVALWLLDTPRVRARMAGEESPPSLADLDAAVALGVDRSGSAPAPGVPDTGLDAPRLRVAIPARIHRVKEVDPELARRWRTRTRAALIPYLDRGYEVRELVRNGNDDVSWYLLARREG